MQGRGKVDFTEEGSVESQGKGWIWSQATRTQLWLGAPWTSASQGSQVSMASAKGKELADWISEAPELDKVYLDKT